jgi:hemolysin D
VRNWHRFDAFLELLGRYKTVFAHYWKERSSLGGRIFNEQEAEFLPAALSLQEKPISTTAKLTGRTLMIITITTLLWSIFGKMDIVVNASGKIIPSGHTKAIASVDVASVRALFVTEGQAVKAGDVLVELDSSATDSEHDKAQSGGTAARLQMARSKALIDAVRSQRAPALPTLEDVSPQQMQYALSQLNSQYRDFRTKLTRLDDEIARYSSSLPLAAQRAQDYKALSDNKDVSMHAWQEKEQARIDVAGQLHDAINQRQILVDQTIRDANEAFTDAYKTLQASVQDARRSGEHSKLMKLTSPVDGTVQQVTVHTVGGVVPAAQPLMMIVPKEQQVEVEAMIENKDIGFVREGQHAEVKIDAFDYTRYGTVAATVTHVSRDAIQDEKRGLLYSVKVALLQYTIVDYVNTVPLAPGMSVNVEIKTGERRIIQYLLSPLIQHGREALHER